MSSALATTTLVTPLVYYFPLLWKVNTICQEGLVVGEKDFKAVKLDNLASDVGTRVLCEKDCPIVNFNGLLNYADTTQTCKDKRKMRYHCPCQSPITPPAVPPQPPTPCLGDSIRLTEGTNGFLEVFGYDPKGGRTGWLPVCMPTAGGPYRALAILVCHSRNLELVHDDEYLLTLPPPRSPYTASTAYFSYQINCPTSATATPGAYPDFRTACTFEAKSAETATTCEPNAGFGPLHIRCMEEGTEPATMWVKEPTDAVPADPTANPPVAAVPASPGQFEMFEPTLGRWSSISELGWTPVENDRACRQVGKLDLFGASRMYSCKQYFEYYRSRGMEARSGQYQVLIDEILYPVVCDMHEDDPGWTLLFNNTFDRYWTRATAEMVNEFRYTDQLRYKDPDKKGGRDTSYSILKLADKLVQMFPGRMYDFRINAYGTGYRSAGGVFRVPKSQSLLTSTVTNITTVIHRGPRLLEDPKNGFTLNVPHFSPFTDGNSIYGMNTNSRPASLFGNIIARNIHPAKKKYSFWVPGRPELPPFISMWIREVTDDRTLTDCNDQKYLFEARGFNRRQIFSSSSALGFEPWKSCLKGSGWTSTPSPEVANTHEWIMVDLLRVHKISKLIITGIAPQLPTDPAACWVTKFRVQYRSRWSQEPFEEYPGILVGNKDATSLVQVEFNPPIVARQVRLSPEAFEKRICLRWTLFGCPQGPIYPSEQQMYLTSPLYAVSTPTNPILPQKEEDYLQKPTCTDVKVELNLRRATLITGLIFAGNPYIPSKLDSIRAFASADGSRGNLRLISGSLRGVQTTEFKMDAPNEPVYVTVDRAGARMIRLVLPQPFCPFRFEVVGIPIPDWCNAPLDINPKDYTLTVSSCKLSSDAAPCSSDGAFYGISQLPLKSTLTSAGYGAWVPDPDQASVPAQSPAQASIPTSTVSKPFVSIDLRALYTITALAIGGQRERTEWTSVILSYGALLNEWTTHSDIALDLMTGRFEGGEGVTVQLNPPIGQAQFIKLELLGSKISLKLELFGCKLPWTNSDSIPGLKVLRATQQVLTNPQPDIDGNSVRDSYLATVEVVDTSAPSATVVSSNKTFMYNRVRGSSNIRTLVTQTVTGYRRSGDWDLYWMQTSPARSRPDWGVRPIIANLKCHGSHQYLEQCHWRHAHDDPADPSSPVVPVCSFYCGDPGRISQTRKRGYHYAHKALAPVHYDCLFDDFNPPSDGAFTVLSSYITCNADGHWSSDAPKCPMYSDSTQSLAENRPWVMSSVDSDLSWLAKSYSGEGGWVNKRLLCQATKQETFPYVMVDLKGPVEVQLVKLDFGISRDLALSDFDILVTNNRVARTARDDVCYQQRDVTQPPTAEGSFFVFRCQRELIGRFVFITFGGSDQTNLFICDVNIFGTTPSPFNNLADQLPITSQLSTNLLSPTATVSSLGKGYHYAYLAVDGNTNTGADAVNYDPTAYNGVSCSATAAGQATTWWAVDMGQESALYGLTIYFPPDRYAVGDKLVIRVSQYEPSTAEAMVIGLGQSVVGQASQSSRWGLICGYVVLFPAAKSPSRIKCDPMSPLYGRYVTVTLETATGKNALVLCEVRVWGRNCTEYLDRALFKPVTHSGTMLDSSSSSYLVDGNRDTRFIQAYDNPKPTAVIHLLGEYFLDYIEVETSDTSMFGLTVAISLIDADGEYLEVQSAISTRPNQMIRIPLTSPNHYAKFIKLGVLHGQHGPASLQVRDVRAISRACAENEGPLGVDYRNLAAVSAIVHAGNPDNDFSADRRATVDGIKFPRETLCFTSSQAIGVVEIPPDSADSTTVVVKLAVRWQAKLPLGTALILRVAIYGSFKTQLEIRVGDKDMTDSATAKAVYDASKLCGFLTSREYGIKEKSVVCGMDTDDGPDGGETPPGSAPTVVVGTAAGTGTSTATEIGTGTGTGTGTIAGTETGGTDFVVSSLVAVATSTVFIPIGREGQFVTILTKESERDKTITLCEVEVWGRAIAPDSPSAYPPYVRPPAPPAPPAPAPTPAPPIPTPAPVPASAPAAPGSASG
ncbi:hypothetical protein BV898_07232 [Hypsibius exemplaris]|uniref:F5/8 type C domain-containing protein n=1 Tax=Hypsibius exemplaris TaxID=2072580 RepID=A0A1W0WUB9_HYPEX|nr:hypothetical protein BV898_07232 [Hypsibius exemplaris]